jgi:predicted DNA-binding transcriptional regulator YafY
MAKKSTKKLSAAARAVTFDRAARLYRLLLILNRGPQPREVLMKRLNLDVRGFYRDLELLRSSGISLPLSAGRYRMEKGIGDIAPCLPFPDPGLSLGEAILLGKGRSLAHAKLRKQIARIMR